MEAVSRWRELEMLIPPLVVKQWTSYCTTQLVRVRERTARGQSSLSSILAVTASTSGGALSATWQIFFSVSTSQRVANLKSCL